MDCPICSEIAVDLTQEKSPDWIEARAFCHRHRGLAELLTGERYDAVVAESPEPLDGTVESFLLNPVRVEGRPAWVSWAAGSYQVWEQVFASHDYFDFMVQHRREHVGLLHQLHRNRALFGSGVDMRGLMSFLQVSGGGTVMEHLERLSSAWWLGERLREGLGGRPHARSAADALSIARRTTLARTVNEGFFEAVAALLAIAERRFAHVAA